MVHHVVTLLVKRYYRIYVDDETGQMTAQEINDAAKRQLIEDDNPDSCIDIELNEIEPDDIIATHHAYDIDGD